MVTSLEIIWSPESEKDLKLIYCLYSDKNETYANQVIFEIIHQTEKIIFPNQFQADEILGLPFRRFFVKNWRIIYQVNQNQILIYRIFDVRKERTT